MFGNQVEDRYINSASAGDAALRGRSQLTPLLALIAGIIVFIVWASLFEIEEVTTGTGRVIPSRQIQVVQTLEGGLISELLVNEGEIVEEGQVLMQIDDTGFSSQLGEMQQRESALLAEKARLEAEAGFSEEVTFPNDLLEKGAGAISVERRVFTARRRQLAGELRVLDERLVQREAELNEMMTTGLKLEATIAPLSREVDLTRDLLAKRVVGEVELLRLVSRLEELKGDLAVGKAGVPRVHAAIREAKNQIETTKGAYILAARERQATLQGELAQVQEAIKGASDRVNRTQLRAPARGIVNKINITTIGAVVQPGENIIEIVPLDDGLLIEADVRPKDVAFIRTGERASVKLTAYDYLVYGALDGQVLRIGADTVSDNEGNEFFKVIVKTKASYLGSEDSKFPITPGMVANIDIQTGRKTVMTYLLKPLLRARSEALRER